MNDERLGRLAIIREIVDRLEDVGKTQVQKIVYFIQESVEVPLGYSFRMHYYGPYSDGLDSDLSLAAAMGYVYMKPDFHGFGYHVTPSEADAPKLPASLLERIDDVQGTVDDLGELETWVLELCATIHFVDQLDDGHSVEEVTATVSRLKPKFSSHEIGQGFTTLQSIGLMQESTAGTE